MHVLVVQGPGALPAAMEAAVGRMTREAERAGVPADRARRAAVATQLIAASLAGASMAQARPKCHGSGARLQRKRRDKAFAVEECFVGRDHAVYDAGRFYAMQMSMQRYPLWDASRYDAPPTSVTSVTAELGNSTLC